jgi:hypothetical protein
VKITLYRSAAATPESGVPKTIGGGGLATNCGMKMAMPATIDGQLSSYILKTFSCGTMAVPALKLPRQQPQALRPN